MNKKEIQPFGLLFEEYPIEKKYIIPVYDEEEDISVVIDRNGRRIPAVEHHGNLGTKTATKVQIEGTDDDPGSVNLSGTRTLTEIKKETSDSDDAFSLRLNTMTGTSVNSEQSDEDVETNPRPPLTTRTITNVVKENTDQD